jgi:predicted aspartyl protease
VIRGTVTDDGSPTIVISVAGYEWTAVIDTGFNGGLELPEAIQPYVNARPTIPIRFLLGGGKTIVQQGYDVDFPFDGRTMTAEATFVPGGCIVLGTALLHAHRLEIDFVARTVKLDRVTPP